MLPAATHPGTYVIVRVDDGPFDNDADGVSDDMIPSSVLADPKVTGVVFKRSLSIFLRDHTKAPTGPADYDFSALRKALAATDER